MFKLLRNAAFFCVFFVLVNCSGSGDGAETTPTAGVTPTSTTPTPAPAPSIGLEISAVDLVAFTDNKDLLTVGSLTNGSELNLSTMPTNLINVVAHSSDQAATGSVHFLLEGPLGIDRWENNPIYTMAVDSTNLDISQDQLPAGNYVLTLTPYALPDMGGDSGASMRIAFTVVNTTPGEEPVDSSIPRIGAVDLVAAPTEGDLVVVKRMSNGAAINLNEMPTDLINFVAIPTDMAAANSVSFTLIQNGSTDALIDRFENTAIYTAAKDSENINIQDLAGGSYELTITPYSEDNLAGDAGEPYVLSFSVIPFITSAITAANDEYDIDTNASYDSGTDEAVSVNDTFDDSQAVFVVVDTPENGSVSMDILGQFVYQPAPDFAGTDQFVYEIRQNNEVAQATVTFYVTDRTTASSGGGTGTSSGGTYEPTENDYNSGGNTGFTEIKASSDTKVVYVSSKDGSDSNSCTSEGSPCKSLNAGIERLRAGYADHLRLKRGGTWRDQDLKSMPSGRSPEEPHVIYYYGDAGARPKIENRSNFFHNYKLTNVHVIGLEFSAYELDTSDPAFTGAGKANLFFLGANHNLLFEDNVFNHSELIFQKWTGGNPMNITVRRNIWTGAYHNTSSYSRDHRPSNLYADGVVNLKIEENVFDYGGWHPTVPGAGADQFNHNVYLQHGTDKYGLVRGNIFSRASSHGIQMRAGGIADNNFFGRNAIAAVLGYENGKACAINNVITEGHSMVRGNNACAGTGQCTSALWGLHFSMKGKSGWESHNNIVHSRSYLDTEWSRIYSGLSVESFRVEADNPVMPSTNNHSWKWESPTEGVSQNYPNPGLTLGDYYEKLVADKVVSSVAGSDGFDKFMNLAKSRPVGIWPSELSAYKINDFIRSGFGISGDGICH